uniref:AP5B1 middle domain-containing protein n=1 Tax=Timema genevievae TaxID=629358 RepID=A0A7R9JZV2_TIMGE|nr:unnamed protein product [Timema genevievae]
MQSFLQEKGVSASTKINIASFLELEARNLLFTVSDIELTYSTFKNQKAFLTTVGESAATIKGQCLVSMTTILLQLFGKKEVENEVIGLFSEHLLFLLSLVQQSNNPSNVYVRFMAANCLTEVELNFPRILRECINNLYSLSLIETSVAHQQYMCLLALTVKNSLASESLETLWGKSPKILFKDKLHQVDETELTIADINQMVSFLLDQLVLCTKEGSFWIICLVMEMMRSRTDLQMSVQVLKPILIHNLRVYNPQSFHNHFGSMLFEEKDRTALLNQTLVNATHPSLPACLKLLYLDWTGSYLQGDTPQTPQVTKLVPGVFDGPETQLKKLHILSGFLKNKSGMMKAVFIGSVLAFSWRESEKIFKENHPQYSDRNSNLDLPVIVSLVYCESSALDHAATEEVTMETVICFMAAGPMFQCQLASHGISSGIIVRLTVWEPLL